METKLKNILNAVYELEGLVQLAINGRQDIAMLRELIIDKTNSVRSLCEQLPSTPVAHNEPKYPEVYDTPVVTPSSAPNKPKPATPPCPPPAPVVPKPAPVVPKPAPVVPPPPQPLYQPGRQSAGQSSATPPPPIDTSRPLYNPAPNADALPPRPQAAPTSETKRLRRYFPINDIFLFRRELFNGSDEDFNASLAIVEELPGYADAEAYFYNDLQWEADNPTVVQFMRIINKYYKQ